MTSGRGKNRISKNQLHLHGKKLDGRDLYNWKVDKRGNWSEQSTANEAICFIVKDDCFFGSFWKLVRFICEFWKRIPPIIVNSTFFRVPLQFSLIITAGGAPRLAASLEKRAKRLGPLGDSRLKPSEWFKSVQCGVAWCVVVVHRRHRWCSCCCSCRGARHLIARRHRQVRQEIIVGQGSGRVLRNLRQLRAASHDAFTQCVCIPLN